MCPHTMHRTQVSWYSLLLQLGWTHFNPHTYVGWQQSRFNPDSLIKHVVRTQAIQIQPGFNLGSSASADKPFSTSVRLQRETHSSPAPKRFVPSTNVFIASDKHVRLQCDSYLEVSSRDYVIPYLVACNERVHLQCEIIFFGGGK